MSDTPAPETKSQHWQRRGMELNKLTKGTLCGKYRTMGYVGSLHPLEKWRKDEVINAIVEVEWSRLPAERKLPTPVRLTPPCDTCGKGEGGQEHAYGGSHHYSYTHDVSKAWVPAQDAPDV